MKPKKPLKTKELCAYCYNDEYNYGLGGAKGCWNFSKAKIVKRLSIGTHQRPPYDRDKWTWKLSCYNRQQMCYPSPDVITREGYWR